MSTYGSQYGPILGSRSGSRPNRAHIRPIPATSGSIRVHLPRAPRSSGSILPCRKAKRTQLSADALTHIPRPSISSSLHASAPRSDDSLSPPSSHADSGCVSAPPPASSLAVARLQTGVRGFFDAPSSPFHRHSPSHHLSHLTIVHHFPVHTIGHGVPTAIVVGRADATAAVCAAGTPEVRPRICAQSIILSPILVAEATPGYLLAPSLTHRTAPSTAFQLPGRTHIN